MNKIYFGASLTDCIFALSQSLVHVELGLLGHIQTNALGYRRSRGWVPVIKHSCPLEDLHNQTSSWIAYSLRHFKCLIFNVIVALNCFIYMLYYLWWSLSECRLPVHNVQSKCLLLHPVRQKSKSLMMITRTYNSEWYLNSKWSLLVSWWCRLDFCLGTCVLHSWPDPPARPGILVWEGPWAPWW